MSEISIGPLQQHELEEANRIFNVAFEAFWALRIRLLSLAIVALFFRVGTRDRPFWLHGQAPG